MLTRPPVLLRLESGGLLAVALVLYAVLEGSWLVFALLLLAPDVGMIGYARGPRIGAATYNLTHTAIVPALVSVAAFLGGQPLLASVGLIWLAHIGMDRVLGYGLKLPTDFKDTHLGRIGRRSV